ncbi:MULTISPECIES: hypothetical protein [unclassified Pseudomonas]|uniref:hypothetical protein n=1 Tax=unclassified Pseudomonas TaxID=196821 RepID=UPI000C86B053|nr:MULTISPECIES: hypothetical protein [unclassified Pseudomonas]PMV96411.1 hypothetical protein C1X55_18915 [Pseudomonas sp. GW460-C8]PMW23319.1 hypothetical protein C1X53_12215 [Pseudomonas sp. GW456-E6]PMW24205.1 hypothetical protein C1X40_05170 [Pseudomonas sp. GW456-11-11-14-TSB2]PMW40099.1 hypothetical protein C1X45_08480 [Pseudomonas sp. GW460-7]PMW41210.1 hypothetical protein C1X48_07115 [Pseudomonas sp. FW305-3-2-15-A-R2A1]
MNHEYTPIEIGLDALGVVLGQAPLIEAGINGRLLTSQVQEVNERIERSMLEYPEIRTEILAAGMKVLLEVSSSLEHFREVVLPRLDRTVDNVAA